jgi:hypothetical protein
MSDQGHAIDYPPLANRRCIAQWDIKYMANFMWEIPTRILAPRLPTGIHPVEPRPGVSLLNVGHVAWNEGNFRGEWPAFDEVTIMALVQPDLSRTIEMPRFCFFVFCIAANYQPFVVNERKTIHLPTWHTNVRHVYQADPYRVEVADDHGPMFTLQNTKTQPTYEKDRFFGQYYAVEDDALWFGIWEWEGVLSVHQDSGAAGQLHDHPVFAGIEIGDQVDTCFMQLFTKPGVPCIERFFEPIRVA